MFFVESNAWSNLQMRQNAEHIVYKPPIKWAEIQTCIPWKKHHGRPSASRASGATMMPDSRLHGLSPIDCDSGLGGLLNAPVLVLNIRLLHSFSQMFG